jgi:hypothetical protein
VIGLGLGWGGGSNVAEDDFAADEDQKYRPASRPASLSSLSKKVTGREAEIRRDEASLHRPTGRMLRHREFLGRVWHRH